jgi:hypothetical protein
MCRRCGPRAEVRRMAGELAALGERGGMNEISYFSSV